MMSAATSLGLSLLWDTEIDIDKYTYSVEERVKVGGSFQMPSTVEF
jgi:hypothetical protein